MNLQIAQTINLSSVCKAVTLSLQSKFVNLLTQYHTQKIFGSMF